MLTLCSQLALIEFSYLFWDRGLYLLVDLPVDFIMKVFDDYSKVMSDFLLKKGNSYYYINQALLRFEAIIALISQCSGLAAASEFTQV